MLRGSIALQFYDDTPQDLRNVLDTAGLLEITEFEVFRIAYERWYGCAVKDSVLEPFFTAYMFNDVVPFWVREFTRVVHRLNRSGELDPRSFGILQPRYRRAAATRGLRYPLIAVMVVTALFILADLAAQVVETNCFFPPCY